MSLVLALLAEASPHSWNKELRRAEVLSAYLDSGNSSHAAADNAGARLGLSRRRFYGLLRNAKRVQRVGPNILGTKNLSKIDTPSLMILDQVIEDLPAGTLRREIYRETRRRCEDAALEAPKVAAVARRVEYHVQRRPGAEADLCQADLLLEHSALSINIFGPDERLRPCFLSVVIHPSTGRILGHHLGAELPNPASASAAVFDSLRAKGANQRVGKFNFNLNRAGTREWSGLHQAISDAGLRPTGLNTRSLGYGLNLHRLLAGKLGRIDLLPRLRTTDSLPARIAGEGIALSKAREIVAYVIEEWNKPLLGPTSLRDFLTPKASAKLAEALRQETLTTVPAAA